jgi:ParB/RepB/Spo0J family partition protein
MSQPANKKAGPTGEQIIYALRSELTPSLTNRKNFSVAALEELAETMKPPRGIDSPIIVRKLPGSRVQDTWENMPLGASPPIYEIVAGERRWRAAGIAGLEFVPIIVRDLSDAEVLDIQLIENLQRIGLTPLEEGEAFQHRMENGGLNADQVGKKVGRSREYVYTKLKLLDLCSEAKQALRDEKLEPSSALRIARVPDSKLQLKALNYAITPKGDGELPTVREVQRWLRQNVMLQLDAAPFSITATRLIEGVGSCKECPKRTGANPDIFSDVDGKDICTDPPCFNNKAAAHRAGLLEKAEAEGLRLVDGAEAKQICKPNSSELVGYSSLSQQRLDTESGAQLGKLLGDDAPGAVLIEHPTTKELIRAVPAKEAEAILLAKGLIKANAAAKNDGEKIDKEVADLKASIKRESEKAARTAMFTRLSGAIRGTPDAKAGALLSSALMRAWLLERIDDLDHEDTAIVLQVSLDPKNFSTTEQEAARLRLQGCDGATLFRSMALYMMLDDRRAPVNGPNDHHLFDALATSTGVNLQALRKIAEKEVKDNVSSQIEALKATQTAAQKPSTPTSPLPQAKTDLPPEDKAKPKLKKGKLSAEEATTGIAAAMQGIEGKSAPADLRPAQAWPFPTASKPGAAPTAKPKKAASSKAAKPSEVKKPAEPTDPQFVDAVVLITREQKANVRLLKTHFSIGTGKALELMTRLEQFGKVSACDQRGAREVLVAA